MTLPIQFEYAFKALTGHPPFPWQKRLYEEHFEGGILPSAVVIPTGLGKTAVMDIWLLARAAGAKLPRRLVYVVDRRAVVDQATESAMRLRERLEKDEKLASLRGALHLRGRPLPISTLRGQHADNREWMVDPAGPAIIVGTVDMVGSRLLFEGYGLSRRMRPYAAGLLGCDSLVVLDEAHIARPFERLLKAIEEGQRTSSTDKTNVLSGQFSGSMADEQFPPPFRVLPLSATLGMGSDHDQFYLDGDDRADAIIRERLEARKSLEVEDLEFTKIKLDRMLAERAWNLMQKQCSDAEAPPRIVIYCDLRKDAEQVADNLRKSARKEKSQAHVILFVGGRRVRERQKVAEELKEYGFFGDIEALRSVPVFLVATSAGEVGVDLDANHMVCDLVAWERMVQRLGRVNRRGASASRVIVLNQGPPRPQKADMHANKRHEAVRSLLDALPRDEIGGHRASPGVLLDHSLQYADGIKNSTTLSPLYPVLTRPLVDAWAMTSLDDHAGRPEVAPWLRGWIEDDEPRAAVIWRRYLPVNHPVHGGNEKGQITSDVKTFFAAAPPQTTEVLEVEARRVVEWLGKRACRCLAIELGKEVGALAILDGENMEEGKGLLAPLTRNGAVAFLLDSANQLVDFFSITELSKLAKTGKEASDLRKGLIGKLAGKQLVVDARLGGLRDGLLDSDTDEPPSTIDNAWTEADEDQNVCTIRVDAYSNSEQVADGWQSVLAIPYGETVEGEAVSWLVVSKRRAAGEGEEARSIARRAQRLDEHQQWTGKEAERISQALELNLEDKDMLIAAARHHDDGKAASRWQRAFGAKQEDGPYAKTTRCPNQRLLNGFRHEIKSVLDAEKNGLDGLDRTSPRFDLALHIIAAHHGNARPTIGISGYDDLPPSKAESGAHDIAVRFALQQRNWGPWGLAWWEALLRAADQAASRLLEKEEE